MSRAELVYKRAAERLDAVLCTVPPIQPGAQYWLDSDCSPSYCRRCVVFARGEEFEFGPPLSDRPFYLRTDLERLFYEGIDGGFDTESDSTSACELCRETLSYILTDYGVQSEFEYYRESPLCEVRDEDSYALDRLALNIWEGAEPGMILSLAVVVNQAWRLIENKEPHP